MARIARVIAPGYPHHVTQRGNRRQRTFFSENDYHTYIELLARHCSTFKTEIWAYCLMPNHVHLIAVPLHEDSLSRAIGETHRCYSRHINSREDWRGHLWQDRFASFPMDEYHLLAAARYIEMNPVAAGIVTKPDEYKWSSARAHLERKNGRLVNVQPLLEIIGDWHEFLRPSSLDETDLIHKHERSGRPLGGDSFIIGLEIALRRRLTRQRPGPKRNRN